MNRLLPTLWLLWSVGIAPAAATEPASPWVELRPVRMAAEELPDAVWFEPPSATLLELVLPSQIPPQVWRVEQGPEGRILSRVAQRPEEGDAGHYLLWIPAAPSVPLAVIAPDGERVRAYIPSSGHSQRAVLKYERELVQACRQDLELPDGPAPTGEAQQLVTALARLRDQLQERTPGERTEQLLDLIHLRRAGTRVRGTAYLPRSGAGGRALLLPQDEAVEVDLAGPGEAVLEVRITASELAGGASSAGGPTAFDLVVTGAATGPLRFSSSVLCSGDEQACPVRQFQVPIEPGRQTWSIRLEGATGELKVRSYRLRPIFPDRRGGAPGAPADLREESVEPSERVAREALGLGRYGEAEEAILDWLSREPDDPDAQAALGHLQARSEAAGALPAAWALLERTLAGRDLGGPWTARRADRSAARHAWLQGAYLSAGVVAPGEPEELAVALRPDDGLARPNAEGWYRGGARAFLPAGDEVLMAVPQPGDAGDWTTVRWLGLNTTGRPAVIAITVDDGEPLRVLLSGERTPFRLALAPGTHRIRWQGPAGGGDGVALASDRAVEQPRGPWGSGFPALRAVPFVRLEAGEISGAFQLPPGAGDQPVRLEARWVGSAERSFDVEDATGSRHVILAPADQVPAIGAGAPGAERLAVGTASFDVQGGALSVRNRGDGAVWVRLLLRQPRGNELDAVPASPTAKQPFPGALDVARLGSLSAKIAHAGSPDEEAQGRLERAELLASAGLVAYAERDCQRAVRGREPGDELAVRAAAIIEAFPTRIPRTVAVAVAGGQGRSALALDPMAAAGFGPAAWLDELDAGDPAQLLAIDELAAMASRSSFPSAIHRELARRTADEAMTTPEAALAALVHADAVLSVHGDPRTAAIRWRALEATRSQVIGAARSSGDRVKLTDAWGDGEPDAAQQARQAMLGEPLGGADQFLAAGSRWTVLPGPGAGREFIIEVFCDDLRPLPAGAPERCPFQLQVEGEEPQRWSVPAGQTARRDIVLPEGRRLFILHEEGGRARYAALHLSAPGGWAPPPRSAWFHLAAPDAPVEHGVCGPTLLVVEASPAEGAGPGIQVRVDGELRGEHRWPSVSGAVRGDGGARYGEVVRLEVPLAEAGPRRVELAATDGSVAVRISRREAHRTILPRAPDVATERTVAAVSLPAVEPGPAPSMRQRLPAPSPGGTVDSRIHLWNRSSLDQEPVDERYLYMELSATHRLRLGRSQSWLAGGALIRAGTPYPPAAGWNLSTYHRLPTVGLRLSGRFNGLAQSTEAGSVAAATLSLRLDRPVRLGAWTLVPHLRARGFFQPSEERQEGAGETYLELSSSYRTAHPFALSAGADLRARPWVNGEWLLGLRAVSNADVKSLDLVGGRTELRLYPRPVGVALAFDLSRRLQDDWRDEAWWRAEGSLRAWIDLGPPALWIRPSLQLSYLIDPSRLELTVGVAVTPGRRAVEHFAPPELLFEDIRGPEFDGGRWRR